MFVVAYGSPGTGFKLHGPFDTEEAAGDWGEGLGEGGEFVLEVHEPAVGPPYRLYVDEEERLNGCLKPVRWSWDDAYADGPVPSYTWPGFWDGSRWNGFPNIKVTKQVFDELVRPTLVKDLEGCYEGDDLVEYLKDVDERGVPDEFGLCSLGYGYTPTIVGED